MTTAAGPRGGDRGLLPDLAGRRELVGGWAAITPIHYFVVEAVAIAAWLGSPGYERREHVISDLGAAYCGPFNGYQVCSPLNWLMNASFVLQGVAMILGAVLVNTAVLSIAAQPGARVISPRMAAGGLRSTESFPWIASAAVRVLVFIAGVGQAMVGLVPEDTDLSLHLVGAGMYFIAGPLSLAILGVVWRRHTQMSWFVLVCGAVSLGTTIYILAVGLRVEEPGAIERTMAYPIIMGLSMVGLVVARRVARQRKAVRAASRSSVPGTPQPRRTGG
ncbi:hypothetical membrane protein [Arthrobacter sp. cf158]|uniref:DUF998 domain-containing protein n=1 Tax=Arthrobacter sp. cf158 TaxID=1761744 RepID=UPI0008978AAA|nr:DUF998 domain-containing protein [Arthrobacter sp. cf158]SDW00973.1 hypothetical membrane protein [Arthrobacter sp. cf158]